MSAETPNSQPVPALSLLDSTSIIVGIIIGSTIYESSPAIAAGATAWLALPGADGPTGSAASALASIAAIWLLGGAIALVGALCYAELGASYPRAGGTYVFLSEALGRQVGFAFAWAEFWIVRPGNVGAIAFVLANYARQTLVGSGGRDRYQELALAALAIVLLSVINALGLHAGRRTQNVLTGAKLLGLAAIVLTALTLPAPPAGGAQLPADGSLSLALILIMFAYGGWADMSFVAAEVRDPERNIFRALVLGTLAVAGIYLAVNIALALALGIGGLARSPAVAAEVMSLRFGSWGAKAISLLVVVSCLGAINGMLFTGARVFYALGLEQPAFRWLGQWDPRRQVPLRALLLQAVITLALVIGFGLAPGGFQRLVVFTGPFYWGFIGLVGVASIVLRLRGALAPGGYRVPLFPLAPLFFVASSGAMVFAAVRYALDQRHSDPAWSVGAWWAAGVIASGVAVAIYDAAAIRRATAAARRPSDPR